jgi:hypothetical protein
VNLADEDMQRRGPVERGILVNRGPRTESFVMEVIRNESLRNGRGLDTKAGLDISATTGVMLLQRLKSRSKGWVKPRNEAGVRRALSSDTPGGTVRPMMPENEEIACFLVRKSSFGLPVPS